MNKPVNLQSPAVDARATSARPRRVKDMIAVNFGNALEWYDWNIYTIFAPVFAAQIFRADNTTSALLATLAVFAVGFVARPIGGYVFGAYADRVGRKRSLFLAMMITAVGSLMIAFTPTFATAGIFASVMLVAARLLQGLAHGGEMGTAVTYLVERAPKNRRALFGSTSWVSVVLGTMMATVTGLAVNGLLTPDQVSEWGWRLAFGIGGLLGLYALYLRRFITESEHFTAAQQDTADQPAKPASSGVLAHWRGLLIIFTISAGGSLMFYTWLIYLPTHAQVAHGMTPTSTLTASLIAQAIFLVAIIGAGLLGDRIGRRPMIIAFGVAFLVLPFPLFGMLDGSFFGFLAAQVVALLAVALLFGVNGAVWSEVLAVSVRAKGVATMLSLATALFGGTAPYVITWLSGHDLLTVFLVYLMVIAAATGATGLVMRETKGSDLST